MIVVLSEVVRDAGKTGMDIGAAEFVRARMRAGSRNSRAAADWRGGKAFA